ncbi:MAG TPA: hypothetical protein VFZ61_07375 [Polyangiales bacterium]
MIVVESRRRSRDALERQYPGALFLDVTSRGESPWVKFSPFYPIGGIPVPFSEGYSSMSVEGIWQGLKVFEREGIDTSRFQVSSMRGLKRTVRAHGRVLGHQRGVHGTTLLEYVEARRLIYLPAYQWVLQQQLATELELLRKEAAQRAVVLLDYETNADVLDVRRPLSHASLVARHVEGTLPEAPYEKS